VEDDEAGAHLQRRCYWILENEKSDVVLVHYLTSGTTRGGGRGGDGYVSTAAAQRPQRQAAQRAQHTFATELDDSSENSTSQQQQQAASSGAADEDAEGALGTFFQQQQSYLQQQQQAYTGQGTISLRQLVEARSRVMDPFSSAAAVGAHTVGPGPAGAADGGEGGFLFNEMSLGLETGHSGQMPTLPSLGLSPTRPQFSRQSSGSLLRGLQRNWQEGPSIDL
jgi:hypothetical protein